MVTSIIARIALKSILIFHKLTQFARCRPVTSALQMLSYYIFVPLEPWMSVKLRSLYQFGDL